MYFAVFVVLIEFLVTIDGQKASLGSIEYCADLNPLSNLTIPNLTGLWYGLEVITHRESPLGEKSNNDCISIEINRINQDVSKIHFSIEMNKCYDIDIDKLFRW